MRSHLNIQAEFHPFLDAGFYFNVNRRMRMIRFGLFFLDLRFWWVRGLLHASTTLAR